MITYTNTTNNLTPDQLHGFFEGWPNPPSPETHLKILRNSDEIVLAIDDDSGNVIGFVNAITDGTLASYIPLLEVLPEYRGQGIGSELMRRIMARLDDYYMIDLLCLENLRGFYEKFGLKSAHAMAVRNFDKQHGRG